MTVLLTKANHDTWFKFKDFDTIEDLFRYINHCYCPLILRDNDYYKDVVSEEKKKERGWGITLSDLAKIWNTTPENAQKINDTRWQVQIYNSYIE